MYSYLHFHDIIEKKGTFSQFIQPQKKKKKVPYMSHFAWIKCIAISLTPTAKTLPISHSIYSFYTDNEPLTINIFIFNESNKVNYHQIK